MTEYEIYCSGKFIRTSKTLDVTNKYSGEVYATTFLADEKILEQAIQSANEARAACAALPSYERHRILKEISEQLTKDKERLGRVLCIESGKPLYLAVAEIERSAQTFMVAAEESRRLPKEYMSLDWTVNGKGREGLVKYFPIGVVAGISPFNFPMNLAVHKIAPAIAAGCPVILKPASTTPLSTLELGKIIDSKGLPDGAVSVLPMDRKTGNLLATHDDIHLLSFTGSPVVGWELKKQAGKKKVVLELGGNSGVIVAEDANVENIIEKCVAGAFAYSGQICIHAQRFFVHKSLFEKFVQAMKNGAEKLKSGDPENMQTKMSVMIDEDNSKRVEKWVSEAIDQGAMLVCGGKREGSYYAPTVLTKTNDKMKVSSLEVFGPVVCVEPFDDLHEAVDLLNKGAYGLQCGIFTDSVKSLDYVFNNVAVGGVIHNDVPTVRFDHMPYGGLKESGLGREGVKYAIHDMMEARVLVK